MSRLNVNIAMKVSYPKKQCMWMMNMKRFCLLVKYDADVHI